MAKALPTAQLDAISASIAATVTTEVVCSGQPANFAGIAAVTLASVAFASGDISNGAGSPTGRTATMASKSGISISSSGTATHVVLASGSVLLAVTTCTSQVLTSGGTVTVPSWTLNVADPV